MQVKTFEVRDSMTFVPAVAIDLGSAEGDRAKKLMRRAGFSAGGYGIFLIHANEGIGHLEYQDWRTRTMREAHAYIEREWMNLADGQVIDVQFILGETDRPKESEL